MCAAGQEDNLFAHFCGRCGDEMLHLCQAEGVFPLCILWLLTCGECGRQLQAWEDRPGPLRMAGMGRQPELAAEPDEEEQPVEL